MRKSNFLIPSLAAMCLASLGQTASADYTAAVLGLNPSHYWQLNETVEGTAVDSAGNIDGTHAGFFGDGLGEIGAAGPPVPGLDSENVGFGANNFASVGLGPGSALADGTMTFAGWFNTVGSQGGDRLWTNNQSDGNTSFQIFFGGGSGDVAANIGIGLNPAVNGFPAEGLPSGSGVGNFHIPESTVAVKDGEWHHIVASRNGNNIEDVLVVIDGVHYDVDTWRDSTDTWGTTSTDAQIATRTPGDGGPSQHALNGTVDEVAIWLGRQLTVEESIALYQAAVNPSTGVLFGDADNDNSVSGSDLLAVTNNFGSTGPADGLLLGDADDDGSVSGSDLLAVTNNFGSTLGSLDESANVPEPASCLIAAAGLLALVAVRRQP